MIKKIKIIHVLFLIIVAYTNVMIAQNIDTNHTTQIENNKNPATDTVIANRDIEVDLEKLSRIATLNARGTLTNPPSNGLVVLNVDIDSTGAPVGMYVVEISDPIWNKPAMDAVYIYAKRHKIKPAIKDGKPIKTRGNLIPIVFDMSIFDKK